MHEGFFERIDHMLQLVTSENQYYARQPHQQPDQRWKVGESSFVPPRVDTRCKVGGTKIVAGELYDVVPRNALTDARGIACIKQCRMIAAKNSRGEMMLCYIANGKPYGGFLLTCFVRATLV